MSDFTIVISAITSFASAVAGISAAVAAARSARFARQTYDATQLSEKRTALRQLTIAASEVLVEARRAESRAAELKLAYRSLAVFSGASGGSLENQYLAEVDKKITDVNELSESAKPFSLGQDNLINGPVDEIIMRETKITRVLTQVRALREDLEREYTFVESQCAIYREKAIRNAPR